MQLRNPFPDRVRLLFVDAWECWVCGENGTRSGGLELHHIWGRISSSALNAAPLCHNCHEKILHTRDTHLYLFKKTTNFLVRACYQLEINDNDFLQLVKTDLQHLKL